MTDETFGWLYDQTEYPVIVTVANNEQGQLVAKVEHPDGKPHFVNVYKEDEKEVEVILSAKKLVEGAMLEDGQFEFGLYDQEGELSTAVNDQAGNIIFPVLRFNAVGYFNFVIKELTPLAEGWSSEKTEFPVQISITDNEGVLVADVDYIEGEAIFVNVYEDWDPPCPPCPPQPPRCRCKAKCNRPRKCHRWCGEVFFPEVVTCGCCVSERKCGMCWDWDENHAWCNVQIKC